MLRKNALRLKEALFVILTAAAAMLICTKSSPLYPMNDWLDANCYMTVGRAMLRGKVPYRDLFEHKGPLVYFLHAAAALVSDDGFFGMFLIETAACAAFLALALKAVSQLGGARPLWAAPLCAAVVYSSGAFSHGDSAEELCLAPILWAALVCIKASEERRALSKKEAVVFGLLAGLVFWTKFNLLGAFVGAAATIVVRNRKSKELLKNAAWAAAGALVPTIPTLLYFVANRSLGDLFEVYFYDNIFVYGGGKASSVPANIANGFAFVLAFAPAAFAIVYLGAASALCRKRFSLFAGLFVPALAAFLAIFAGSPGYQYYPLALEAFVPIGLGLCVSQLRQKAPRIAAGGNISAAVSLAVCAAACYIISPNVYLMKYERSGLPQYVFADIINETDDPKLLNYGFLDGGFYLASGNIPEYRYFCRNNTGYSEMISEQKAYVDSGDPDYIVTRSYTRKKEDFPLYEVVAEADFPYYNRTPTYYLYRRKGLLKKEEKDADIQN